MMVLHELLYLISEHVLEAESTQAGDQTLPALDKFCLPSPLKMAINWVDRIDVSSEARHEIG